MTISAQMFVSLVTLLVLLHVFLLGVAYLIMLERKIASWVQDRIGPNRVGFTFGFGNSAKKRHLGLGQPLADGIKFMVKEDYEPTNVDRGLFYVSPALAVIPALLGWAVMPWGGVWNFPGLDLGWFKVQAGPAIVTVANLNIGAIYVLAIGSLAVYGVVVGAWASNNKYAFFGGLRGAAQMLSYEIPMGLSLLCILLLAGTASPSQINDAQAGAIWFIFQQPLAAVLFFTCVLAECNRSPFDLPEAESELVGGYHTEYSSMKFALFFLGEYFHMLTGSAFFALLFLGGWSLNPLGMFGDLAVGAGLGGVLIKIGIYFFKVVALLALMMLIRWTLPRFRFDQLMRLAWRSLIPIALALLLLTGVFVYFSIEHWLWAGNIGLFIFTLAISPLVPAGPPVNRRIKLAGSRFSPVTE